MGKTTGDLERACDAIARRALAAEAAIAEAETVDGALEEVRTLFDWSVDESEEASVALYSLGRPEILDAATEEIVALYEAWGLLGVDRTLLQIGCGFGRIERAIAPRARLAFGIDVSPRMIAHARARCAGLPNVRFAVASGHAMDSVADESVDVVHAVDSFPYVVAAGLPLAAACFREARRALRPGGDLVVLNFSYRSDADADVRDVAALAAECRFEALTLGAAPFRVWNGVAFRMRRK